MKHIGILKADTWVNVLNWIGIPLIIIYFFSMFVFPFIRGKFDWAYTQIIWHHWQSLNVGALAFTSSLIVLNLSRFNYEKKRAREFVAARAFLPEALSELSSYFINCSPLLKEAWNRASDKMDNCKTPLDASLPEFSSLHKDVFSRCIASSESDVGEHLAKILTCLQIHHSRLQELEDSYRESSHMVISPRNIESYMYSLGELQALVNKTYDFARGEEKFSGSSLSTSDFYSAYSGVDIRPTDFGDLSGITERAVERHSKTTKLIQEAFHSAGSSISELIKIDVDIRHPFIMKAKKVRIGIILASIIIVFYSCYLAFYESNKEWFGVGAGLLAIFAILSISTEYFFPPKPGDPLTAPNSFSRRAAGLLGILSGILWVLSAWPGA